MLPTIFDASNDQNGNFTIIITSKLASGDTGSAPSQILYGKKNVSKPGISFMNSISVLSSELEEGVISGLNEASFTVSSDYCADGYEIGIAIGLNDVIYKECTNNFATFNSNIIPFSGLADLDGGNEELKIFLKDKYGNISDDDILSRNSVNVHIDFGKPSVSINDFSVRMGITLNSESKGSNTEPYFFPLGELVDITTDTTIITPATITDFVFRFAAPFKCRSILTSEDGSSANHLGDTIKGFYLTNNSSSEIPSDYTACTTSEFRDVNYIEVAQDRNLTSNDITFPIDTSQDATFVLKFIDLAGNITKDYLEISIPACPVDVETVEGTPICWRND
jgi:hypothetical protein